MAGPIGGTMAKKKKKPSPKPQAIRNAREAAGLTQAEAAALVYTGERMWRYWEAGSNAMPVGLWELFQIKMRERQHRDGQA